MTSRGSFVGLMLGLLMAPGSLAAQSESAVVFASAGRAEAPAVQADLAILQEAMAVHSDALAHGLLPAQIERPDGASPASNGAGTIATLGAIADAIGPISNGVAGATLLSDPFGSFGKAKTLATIGQGSAVVGSVLGLIAGSGGDAPGAAAKPGNALLAEKVVEFEENQAAAAALLAEFDRASEEVGLLIAGVDASDVDAARAETVLRQGERAFLRFDYVTRRAVAQLASLRAGFAADPNGARRRLEVEAVEKRLYEGLDRTRDRDLSDAFEAITRLRAGFAN
ncbi:MAG: hypothetical protein OEU54_11615 [Gemmatimonadota bacterium]|nr:hypothetical protein [Gemmatimonadota bacterium]